MKAGNVVALAAAVTSYALAAVRAYGASVLTQVRDDSADATVRVGRRLLQRIYGSTPEGAPLPRQLSIIVDFPDDADRIAMLQVALRDRLETDPAMAADVQKLLTDVPPNISTSQVQSGQGISVAGHDITINTFRGSVHGIIISGSDRDESSYRD